VLNRSAELTVVKDVLDPAPEVPASEMALHDIVRQRRQPREQVPNGSSARARRAALLCEHEFLIEAHRNIGVLMAVTDVCSQAWGNAESLERIA
jgi:hypothetical protein